MNRGRYIFFLIICALAIWVGCKKPYLPPAITSNSSYLVVEGVINPGTDSTIIKLSRTVNISSSTAVNPELHAIVTVVSDANISYPLIETGNGNYASSGLNLSVSGKYQVKIITTDGKAYQSDLVPVKNSPPIDSVYYQVKSNGLQINADTHDPNNGTRYYRWSFDETWMFHSAFQSVSELFHNPDTVLNRPLKDYIYNCWQHDASSTIILASSAKLAKDVISGNQITLISSSSEKIGVRYSILAKQYALTADAFNYYQQLKKNTEQLGSIFDAQPSQLIGNIHCVTVPEEPVIGYITAGSYTQRRIFIDYSDLPLWKTNTPYEGCTMDTMLFFNPKTQQDDVAGYIYSGLQTPLYPIQPPPLAKPLGYAASSPECVDCTLRGTNKQPDFWQ